MRADQALVPFGAKIAAVGGVIWLGLLSGFLLGAFQLSVFVLLFLLAPWVVVPLSLGLVTVGRSGWASRWSSWFVRYLLLPGAALTTISFFVREGRLAAALTLPWLIFTVALGIDGLARLIGARWKSFREFCFAIGEGYALVAALWCLASRLGLRPIGFREPIVLLTAVHFHFAGFMAAILAGQVASNVGLTRRLLSLRIALTCAVLGPGLLGLAFLVGPKMKLAAVGLMAIGESGIALGTLWAGWSDSRGIGGRLLLIGGACGVFGMALAGIWAVGEYPLHAFVNLEQMARYHGTLNSLGFGLCSLVGWTLLRARSASA